MKKIEIANMLGVKSRQHIDFVLTGKRNFSYVIAKKAVVLIGGDLDIWMLSGNEKVRRELWQKFVKKTKQRIAA